MYCICWCIESSSFCLLTNWKEKSLPLSWLELIQHTRATQFWKQKYFISSATCNKHFVISEIFWNIFFHKIVLYIHFASILGQNQILMYGISIYHICRPHYFITICVWILRMSEIVCLSKQLFLSFPQYLMIFERRKDRYHLAGNAL